MRNDMLQRFASAVLAVALLAVPAMGGCAGSQASSESAQASLAASQAAVEASGASMSAGADVAATPYDAALSYAKSQDVGQGAGYEWLALALARSGEDPAAAPLSDFSQSMADRLVAVNGELDVTKATEYAKCVLALTSLGMDARDVEGFDVTEKLCDVEFAKAQGMNGPLWSVIALDSSPAYTESADAESARDKLLDTIVTAQGADGGWSFTGAADDAGDVDLTAMALIVLAPYNDANAHSDAAAAIERGLAFISASEEPDGGFAYEGTESSETASQVVIALCSLGIDPDNDERFAKDGASPLTNLLLFQDASGGFSHVKGDPADALASEQGVCALVAVERLRGGQSALYVM